VDKADKERYSDFRIASITDKGALGFFLKVSGPLLDRMLGVRKLRFHYERIGIRGLEKREFLARLKKSFKLSADVRPEDVERIPASGPCIVVANHPLGGLEGIVLADLLGGIRPDIKIIGNLMLGFIRELEEYFILVNNMLSGHNFNVKRLAEAGRWLRQGHCLVVFPAGRVGIYRRDKGYVTDEAWDPIALSLGTTTGASFTPIYIGATSSRLFSVLCRLIYPMKLLLLVREFMKHFNEEVEFRIGRPILPGRLGGMTRKGANAYLRMRVYLLADIRDAPPPEKAAPLSAAMDGFLPLRPAAPGRDYSDRSVALLVSALTRGGGRKGRGKGKRLRPSGLPYSLHPEIDDYMASRGIGLEELERIIEDIEGEPLGLPPGLGELSKAGFAFGSAAFIAGNIPALAYLRLKSEP
jgi:putative hemolysin